MVSLSVNLNKVALLRNSRPLDIPSPAHAATLVMQAGADGVTVHPRPDERHIRPSDVRELAALLKSWPSVEFNIEGNPLHQLMDHVRAVRPNQCTFVPDEVGAATSDHGWDLMGGDGERLRPLIEEARSLGCRVSLFMDPEPLQIELARQFGADRVELYTEPYARAFGTGTWAASLQRYREAALVALRMGIGVNAGHDLNRANLGAFLSAVPGVLEVSIGHALIADALEFGLAHTVGLYLAQIRRADASARELT